MPKVGDKEFAYTPEGIAAAKAEADMTGESMEIVDAGSRSQSYQLGGKIPGQPGFGERPLRPILDNRNPVGVDPIPEPEYRGQSLGRSYQEWKKGGKVSKGKKPSAYQMGKK